MRFLFWRYLCDRSVQRLRNLDYSTKKIGAPKLNANAEPTEVFLQGEVRLLEGLGPSQQRLTVSPPVLFPEETALTGDGGDAEGCIPVLILVLEDLHQYRYVYETFVRAQTTFLVSRTFTTFVGMITDAPDHDALACGFGPAGTDGRQAVIAEMETLIGLHFSEIQKA